jgi:hypothetical protein
MYMNAMQALLPAGRVNRVEVDMTRIGGWLHGVNGPDVDGMRVLLADA